MTQRDEHTDDTENDGTGLTYSETGVDIEDSEAATAALIGAVGGTIESGTGSDPADTDTTDSDYAGVVDLGDRYLGLATDGVGTKLLVAEALGEYSTVGIDCVAMNANDLVAAGISPVAFVDYLAIEEPDDGVAEQVGTGLAVGAERAGVELVGGETAVMPEVISGIDIAGTCAGLASKGARFDGAAKPGDALVGFSSSGIHSNGLTLAREAATRGFESATEAYEAPFPPNPERTVGEVLLEPTRIYTDLLDALQKYGTRAAAHVTGGGWTNLARLGPHRYEITDPLPAGPVFSFVAERGNVTPTEMHRTFNMGTGLVAALAPEDATALADATDGAVIGRVEASSGEGSDVDAGDDANTHDPAEGGVVAIRGLELR